MKASFRICSRSRMAQGTAILALAVAGATPSKLLAQAAGERTFWNGGTAGALGDDKWENGAWDGYVPTGWQSVELPDSTGPYSGLSPFIGSQDSGKPLEQQAQVIFDQTTYNVFNSQSALPGYLGVGDIAIGTGSANFGTLILNGGTLASSASAFIGGWSGDSTTPGYYALGGVLQINGGQYDVGFPGGTNNGSLTIGYTNYTANNGDTGTGTTNISTGTINIAGGTLNYGAGQILAGGREGIATINVSSGTLTGTGTLVLGPGIIGNAATNTTGGQGTLLVSGSGNVAIGTLQFGAAEQSFRTNKGGEGSTAYDLLAMSGGEVSAQTFLVKGSANLGTGTASGDTLSASVSFTGGTLTVNTIAMGLYQQGGTLSPGSGGSIGGGLGVGSLNFIDVKTIGSTDVGIAQSKWASQANYTQAAGGHLLIDLASGSSDPTVSSNDVVHVEDNVNGAYTTSATLNGELDLRPANTYSPTIGDTFNVVTADTITDTSTIALDHLAPNYVFTKTIVSGNVPTGYSGQPTTSGQILQVTFAGHARPGDATRNATIDSNDFAVLAAHYNQSMNVGWGDGDFNGDGTVNALDFDALATNYGKGGTVENPIGGAVAEDAVALGSVVPEPVSGMMLLAVGGLSLLGRNRRRKI